jgi:PhnB protein
MLTFGDSPLADQAPPEWQGKILHATLAVGDSLLMGADAFPGKYEQPKGFQLLLGIEDPADAERVFQALAEKGTVQMPLQKTFLSTRFGMVMDQFGVSWEIHCQQTQP